MESIGRLPSLPSIFTAPIRLPPERLRVIAGETARDQRGVGLLIGFTK